MTRATRLGLLVLVFMAAGICTALGLWQGRRLADRRAANAIAVARRQLPVVQLNSPGEPGELDQRRVTATGSFDHDRSFILRGRAERDVPGVHVVTPLRLDGRPDAILVNRGYVPSNDAVVPGLEYDRAERATVVGLAYAIPRTGDGGVPLTRGTTMTWRRLDSAAVAARLPYPVLDVYLHQTEPEARPIRGSLFPRVAALRPLDDGPHLYYMVQWFGLAAAALAFGGIFLFRKPTGPPAP